jgi:hypothetical protein
MTAGMQKVSQNDTEISGGREFEGLDPPPGSTGVLSKSALSITFV